MFIMETEEQEVRENGERMKASLFSESATVSGDYIFSSPLDGFSLWVP